MPATPSAMRAEYLLKEASEVDTIGVADAKAIARTQSFQTFTDPPGVAFEVKVEGSMDSAHWFPFGEITGPGIRSEGQHVLQFFRATIISIDPGASVTVMISWA